MKTEFTPGPWEVESGMVQTAYTGGKSPNCGQHIPIAYMDRNPGNGTLPCERDANARLVSAAPELLDVLILALPYIECAETDPAYKPNAVAKLTKQIRTAIKKARG